jgi:hypothetical protein
MIIDPPAHPLHNLPGAEIARKIHNPGTLETWTTTSTSSADVDATDAVVEFTVPTTGAVEVEVSALMRHSGGFGVLSLREGSSDVAGTSVRWGMPSTNAQLRSTVKFHVEGLTPGDVKTWKLGFKVTAGTFDIFAGSADIGQFIMAVKTALPSA